MGEKKRKGTTYREKSDKCLCCNGFLKILARSIRVGFAPNIGVGFAPNASDLRGTAAP